MNNVSSLNLKRIISLLFWIGVVSFALTRIISQQVKINKYNAEVAELNETIAALTEKEAELDIQTDLYSSDGYIEELARIRLGYVRSDEVVFKKAD